MGNWYKKRLEALLDNFIFAAIMAGGVAIWSERSSLLMWLVLAGVIGLILAGAFDWLRNSASPILRQLVGSLAVILIACSTAMVCISPPRFVVPIFVLALGACLLVISTVLNFFSSFVEIPLISPYAGGKRRNYFVSSTGTHALCRHPGTLWVVLSYVGLTLTFPSTTMFVAAAIWSVGNISFAAFQDRLIFPREFPNYPQYQRQTPFLIPTKRSIMACLKTIRPKR